MRSRRPHGKPKSEKTNRTNRLIGFETLDARLLLSANSPSFEIAGRELSVASVYVSGDRTSYRDLNIGGGYYGTPDVVATNFLNNYAGSLGLPADVTSQLSLIDTKFGAASSHAYFEQVHDGVPIDGGLINVSMNGYGRVQTVHTSFREIDFPDVEKSVIDVAAAIKRLEQFAGVHQTWMDGQTELVWATVDGTTPRAVASPATGTPELVWRINIHASEPEQRDLIGLVSATDGKVIRLEDRSAHATGSGNVFYPNPYQTQGSSVGLTDNNNQTSPELDAQMLSVTLKRLDEGTGLLKGEWIDVTLAGGQSTHANETDRVYDFDRSHDHFEEVNIYYTVDQVQEYIHSLGYDDDDGTENGIRDFPTMANAHWDNDQNAFYSLGNDAIHFGDAVNDIDLAEDGDIIVHEYGHAIQHDQNPNWGGGEMGAMGEGFSDYLAASFFAEVGDPDYLAEHAASMAEWGFLSEGGDRPGLRQVDGDKIYPDDLIGAVHADGEIWSAALWDIRGQLGRTTTDRIVLESHFELPSSASMVDAAFAILTADANLNGGINAEAIQASFEERGILKAPDDHGNVAADATPVSIPGAVSALVDYADDRDFFAFSATQGTTYEFLTSVDAPADTTLTIYDTNGATQLGFDDNGGPGDASRILWTAATSQNYFVQVSGPNEGDSYDFTVDTIESPVDDHGSDVASATVVDNPSVTAGVIEVSNDVDVFGFPATAGEIYALDVILSSLAESNIVIVDAAGEALHTTAGGDTADLVFQPPTTGTYFALLTGGSQGAYEFSIDELIDDHSNLSADATVMPVPGVTDGTLEYTSDRDTFAVALTGNVTYVFDVELDSLGDSVLRLLDSDGETELQFDDDGGVGTASRIIWRPDTGGTYFLQAGGFNDGETGSYRMRIGTDDHSNSTNGASGLDTGNGQASIDYFGDEDFFRFRGSAGTTYELTIDANPNGDSGLRLYNTLGQQLSFGDSGGTDHSERILWTAPSNGTYYASVNGTVSESPYTISITSTDTPTDDFGDTTGDSELVTLRSSTPGSLEVVGDADVFQLRVSPGTRYVARASHETPNTIQIEIQDQFGTIASGAGAVAFTPTSGRHYAIVQTDLNGTQGSYTFTISEFVDDHGNDSGSATAFEVPETLNGWIEENDDVDLFAFNAVDGERYDFEVVLGSLSDSTLALLGTDGSTQIGFDDDGGQGLGSRINWTATGNATYYLQVSGFSFFETGTYELVTSIGADSGVDDHGDSAETATTADANSTVSGRINEFGDADFFAFTVSQSSEVILRTTLETLDDSTLRLYDRDGTTQLEYDDDGGSGTASRIEWTAPEAGTYYAVVEGFFGDTGDYKLTISSSLTALPCDFVDVDNGCNIDDLDALYSGTNGAPSPLTDGLISQWLIDASDEDNPLKPNVGSLFLHGDVNLDGNVDSTDLGRLLNNFGTDSGLGWGSGNFNSDSFIDSTDLGLLLNNFGHTSPFLVATKDINGDGKVNPLDTLVQINLFNTDDDDEE